MCLAFLLYHLDYPFVASDLLTYSKRLSHSRTHIILSHSQPYALFFGNCSAVIQQVFLYQGLISSFILSTPGTSISLLEFYILGCDRNYLPIIRGWGTIKFNQLSIVPAKSGFLPTTLAGNEKCTISSSSHQYGCISSIPHILASLLNPDSHSLCVEVTNSMFTDSSYILSGNTFVSSGRVDIQRVEGCVFKNITSTLPPPQISRLHNCSHHIFTPNTLSEQNSFKSNTLHSCEDGIYGQIVTGVTSQTLHSFECKNSSFISCVHTLSLHSSSPFTPSLHTQRISNSILPSSPSTSSSTSSSSSLSYSYSSCTIITFTHTTFNHSSASSYRGGGLSVSHTMNNTLTLHSCLFLNCSPSSHPSSCGGGVYSNGFLTISSSNFTDCSAHTYGGAIYFSPSHSLYPQ